MSQVVAESTPDYRDLLFAGLALSVGLVGWQWAERRKQRAVHENIAAATY
jgi:hypothetical protein